MTTTPSSPVRLVTTQEPPNAPVRQVQLATLATADADGRPTRQVKRKLPDESRVRPSGHTDDTDDGRTAATGGVPTGAAPPDPSLCVATRTPTAAAARRPGGRSGAPRPSS